MLGICGELRDSELHAGADDRVPRGRPSSILETIEYPGCVSHSGPGIHRPQWPILPREFSTLLVVTCNESSYSTPDVPACRKKECDRTRDVRSHLGAQRFQVLSK
jgi:hypothetical protein